jgi:acetyl-CoA synthetase
LREGNKSDGPSSILNPRSSILDPQSWILDPQSSILDPRSFPHLNRFQTYEQARQEFDWALPERINIATAICRGRADAVTRVAITDMKEGAANTYTFGGLDFLSDKFATVLAEFGIDQGDSVAVMLPPSAALAIAHLGILKRGAVVVPLATSSEPTWLEKTLTDCDAKTLVVDESSVETSAINLPDTKPCFVVRDLRPANKTSAGRDFWTEVDRASSDFDAVETDATSAAFIFYIESRAGLTGLIHIHRSVLGQLAAFEMLNNLDLPADSVFWTADDWSSPRAVLGVLYPAWLRGCSLVAGGRDWSDVTKLMERYEVTHAFLPSPLLKTLAEHAPRPSEPRALKLRSVISDAPLSPHLRKWTESNLKVSPNEAYGKPETGWIAGGCAAWFPARADSVGRVVPGRSIEILDDRGKVLAPGATGRIAVHNSDPALFTGVTHCGSSGFSIGDWFVTGDTGYKSEDGYLSIHHPHA